MFSKQKYLSFEEFISEASKAVDRVPFHTRKLHTVFNFFIRVDNNYLSCFCVLQFIRGGPTVIKIPKYAVEHIPWSLDMLKSHLPDLKLNKGYYITVV